MKLKFMTNIEYILKHNKEYVDLAESVDFGVCPVHLKLRNNYKIYCGMNLRNTNKYKSKQCDKCRDLPVKINNKYIFIKKRSK
jgi:hypothetical protein